MKLSSRLQAMSGGWKTNILQPPDMAGSPQERKSKKSFPMDKVNAGNYVPQCNLSLITQKLWVNNTVTTQKLFKYISMAVNKECTLKIFETLHFGPEMSMHIKYCPLLPSVNAHKIILPSTNEVCMHLLTYILTYLLHGAESFLRS